jgi:FAD/FMN-containing dehydrogenase
LNRVRARLRDTTRPISAKFGTCLNRHECTRAFGKRASGKKAKDDSAALEAMRAVKRALDPKGILNPGKFL